MLNYKDIFLLENRFMILKGSSYDLHKSQLNGTWIEMLPPLRPVITITEDLQPFEATEETASDVQTYTIEASNLFGAIRVTAPNNYQLSIDGINWRTSLALLGVEGVLSSTIYVRLNLGDVGTYDGNIRHVATGFTSDVAVEGVIAAEVTAIKYGLLYNWYATQDQGGYGIIPTAMAAEGWGVPINANFTTLITYLGGTTLAGGKLKETGTTYWFDPNTGASNEFGFNARGNGWRDNAGFFQSIKTFFQTWFKDDTIYHGWRIKNNETSLVYQFWAGDNKLWGNSFRLVRPVTHAELDEQDGIIPATYTGNDGKVYRCTKIGDQVWIADNLAETKWSNGNFIQGWDANGRVIISNEDWAALTTAAVCVYDNDTNNL
jgi:uncharacterized protein (TIGR02145 family)